MRKEIKRKKKKTKKTPGKQKGREKERKTTSFYICCISLTKVRAGQRPRSPVGKRRSYSFEKPKLHPPKPVTISLELCNYFLLISTEHLKPTTWPKGKHKRRLRNSKAWEQQLELFSGSWNTLTLFNSFFLPSLSPTPPKKSLAFNLNIFWPRLIYLWLLEFFKL